MQISWLKTGWLLATAIAFFAMLFLNFPEIDLWFSGLFFDNGFGYRGNKIFGFIRYVFIDGLTILALLSIIMLIRSASIGKRRAISINVWGFMVTTFLVGPLLMANGLFKAHWGRARPANVDFFGGDLQFTPPLLIAQQCEDNCSFVSGEGSAIATFIIVFAVVFWPNLRGIWRQFTLYAVLPLSLFAISLRIITGRHFLSDTIFAALFCGLVAWALYRLFNMSRYRNAMTWTNLRNDLWKAKRP